MIQIVSKKHGVTHELQGTDMSPQTKVLLDLEAGSCVSCIVPSQGVFG